MSYFLLVSFLLFSLMVVMAVRAHRFGVTTGPPPPLFPLDLDTRGAPLRLAAALRCRTISWPEPGRTDGAAFHDLHALLEQNFPLAHACLQRETVEEFSLLYTWPGQNPDLPPVLLMAHQDVVPVPPETEKDWTHPPFAGAIAKGFVWGRGALDVKSSLMAILEAVETLLRGGFSPSRTVLLAFGHDEEIGGSGNRRIADVLAARGVHPEFVLDEGGMVLEGVVPGYRGAAALVGIAEKGYLTVRLTAHGPGGPSSLPPRSNAVSLLARSICRLEEHPFPAHLPFTGRMFAHLGPGLTFPLKLLFANLWLLAPLAVRLLSRSEKTEATLRTTLAATVVEAGVKENILPTEARALVNARIIPGETAAGVMRRVRDIIDDPRVMVEAVSVQSEPSPVSPVDSHAFELLRRTISQTAGATTVRVAPYLVVGATDSRHFSTLTTNIYRFGFLRLGVDDLPRIHGLDERLSIDNYTEMIGFYYRLLKNMNEE